MRKKKKKKTQKREKRTEVCRVRGGGCLKLALHSGVLGNERDTSRFCVFVAITRKHQMNSMRAMCAGLCMHQCVRVHVLSVYTYGCVCVFVCVCVSRWRAYLKMTVGV